MYIVMPRICLVALIGLPAAGKTQLSRWLLERQLELGNNWNILHLCYDEHFHIGSTNLTDYKAQRQQILQLLSKLIAGLATRTLDEHLELPANVRAAMATTNMDNFLIICDDNHYYRSMRYKLYQLCRSQGCVYAQIHINRTLEQCLRGNEERSESRSGCSIPNAVIQQMQTRLEPPLADNAWEHHSLSIDHNNFNDSLHVIAEFLKSLLQCPIDAPLEPFIKQTQLQSLSHQLDLLLRSGIRSCMEKSQDKAAMGRTLNEKRKQILAQFKQDAEQPRTDQLELDYYVNLLLYSTGSSY